MSRRARRGETKGLTGPELLGVLDEVEDAEVVFPGKHGCCVNRPGHVPTRKLQLIPITSAGVSELVNAVRTTLELFCGREIARLQPQSRPG
jgi:hypothetical protein